MGDMSFFTMHEDQETGESPSNGNERRRQISSTQKLLRRKQISRDLYGSEDINFFTIPDDEMLVDDDQNKSNDNLFFPLRFPPQLKPKATVSHGHSGHSGHSPSDGQGIENEHWSDDEEIQYKVPDNDRIVKATRSDYIKTGVLFCLMAAFVGVCVGWKTHLDESHSIFGYVGVACVTPCSGDVEYRNFFNGHHDHFKPGDVSILILNSIQTKIRRLTIFPNAIT